MKRVIIGLVSLWLAWGCEEETLLVQGTEITDFTVKVSSFNIRFDNTGDGVNQWNNRKENVVSFLKTQDMDIVGMQEVLHSQMEYLQSNLPDYGSVGVGRQDGDSLGEYAPIYYKKEHFELVEGNTFWLSETPDSPSRGWDAVLERICTYAKLRDTRNNRIINIFNTHYDHIGSRARLESAKLIMDSVAAQDETEWVILTGDLNHTPDDRPYDILTAGNLEDCFFSKSTFGPEGTFNGFNPDGTFNRRIDYVFAKGFARESYTTYDLIVSGNFLSDHFPVAALLEYRPL